MNRRVLVAGSLVLDILPHFVDADGERLARTLLSQGKLTESNDFTIYLGGEVGNTGLALEKLGVPVRLYAKVGDDIIGSIIRELLEHTHADSRIDVMPGTNSTASIALALPGRDKSTIHMRGASQLLRAADFPPELFENIALFHFGYPTTMKHLYAREGAELATVLQTARNCGALTSVDTSLPDLNAEPGQVDWRPILQKIEPLLDLFLPSLEEAVFMTRRERYMQLVRETGGKDLVPAIPAAEIQEIAQEALDNGVKIVLIKCGVRGLYLRTAKRESLPGFLSDAWANRELWSAPYRVERVLSTTGAGDTAVAGFLCGLLRGLPPEDTLELASYTAGCCVASYDTISRIEPAEIMLEKRKQQPKR